MKHINIKITKENFQHLLKRIDVEDLLELSRTVNGELYRRIKGKVN